MQGRVDLVGLVTYQGGIPAQRRSPIPALTRLNVEQLRPTNDATTALNYQPSTFDDKFAAKLHYINSSKWKQKQVSQISVAYVAK